MRFSSVKSAENLLIFVVVGLAFALLFPAGRSANEFLKEVRSMQHARKLGQFAEHEPSVAPLRVTTVRPSLRERARAWARKIPAEDRAEVILGITTILLVGELFVSFARALAHYTIIPLP